MHKNLGSASRRSYWYLGEFPAVADANGKIQGVLRLREFIRFANELTSLRMTRGLSLKLKAKS